jgi:hypothetical protein
VKAKRGDFSIYASLLMTLLVRNPVNPINSINFKRR